MECNEWNVDLCLEKKLCSPDKSCQCYFGLCKHIYEDGLFDGWNKGCHNDQVFSLSFRFLTFIVIATIAISFLSLYYNQYCEETLGMCSGGKCSCKDIKKNPVV